MKKDKRIRCVRCGCKKDRAEYSDGRKNTKLCNTCRPLNEKRKKEFKKNNPHLRPSKIKKISYNGNEFSVLVKKQRPSKKIKQSQLYLIECNKGAEVFLKLGLTTKSVKERYKVGMPYKYKVLATMSVKVSTLLDYEQALHSLLSKHSYRPIIKFGGYTECYNLSAKKDIIKFFV